jgi:hypothetical protein
MGSVRAWLAWSAVGGIVLVSPMLAFLMVIASEVLIDGVMGAGVTWVSAIAIGAVGCALFRRILSSEIPWQPGSDEVSAAPPVGAPPG